MKSTILNIKKRVLVVEIPRLSDYEFINRDSKYLRVGNEEINLNISTFSKINLICKGSELSEDIAKNYVLSYSVNYEFVFKDHEGDDYGCETALDSFISAIESNDFYWKNNPIEEPDFSDGTYDDNGFGDVDKRRYKTDLSEWQEAESKTFNPEQTLIFEIL